MAIGFKHGGSGGGYQANFKIIHSSNRPSNPTENTIWVNTTWAPHGWTFSPEMPLRKSWTKNFVTRPFYSSFGTLSGITFSDLGDGKISANGTATSNTIFRANYSTAESGMFLLPAGTYTMHGCPAGGKENTTYALQLNRLDDEGTWVVFKYEYGSGTTFTVDKDTLCCVGFRVWKGATLNNLEVYFQIEKGDTKTSYEIGNASGHDWFKTDSNSDISLEALYKNSKGNSIVVQPAEAYMFRRDKTWDTAWVPMEYEIYQNGAWKALEDPSAPETPDSPWDGYYFNNGNQYTGVTGGWDTTGWNSSGTTTVGSTIVASANANQVARVGTVNTVDLSSVKKLWFDSPTGNNGYNPGYLCALSKKGSTDFAAAVTITAGRGSLDVSSLSGQYYLCVYAGASAYADISAIWKE